MYFLYIQLFTFMFKSITEEGNDAQTQVIGY